MTDAKEIAYREMLTAAIAHARLDAAYRSNPSKEGLKARRAAFRVKRAAEKNYFKVRSFS